MKRKRPAARKTASGRAPERPRQVNLYEAKTHLSELVEQAAAGHEIVIAKAGEPMARLVSLAPPVRPLRTPGRWKGQIWIADDFDAPLPDDILAAFEGDTTPDGGASGPGV